MLPALLDQLLGMLILLAPFWWLVLWPFSLVGLKLHTGFLLLTPG